MNAHTYRPAAPQPLHVAAAPTSIAIKIAAGYPSLEGFIEAYHESMLRGSPTWLSDMCHFNSAWSDSVNRYVSRNFNQNDFDDYVKPAAVVELARLMTEHGYVRIATRPSYSELFAMTQEMIGSPDIHIGQIMDCLGQWVKLDLRFLPEAHLDLVIDTFRPSSGVCYRVTTGGSLPVAMADEFDEIASKYVVRGSRKAEVQIVNAVVQTDHGPKLSMKSHRLGGDMKYAKLEFYPQINVPLSTYFDEFMESSANVLVLIGPPGTGKSTFLRTMIDDVGADTYLAYKPTVIHHPEFIALIKDRVETELTSESMLKEPVQAVPRTVSAMASALSVKHMPPAMDTFDGSGVVATKQEKYPGKRIVAIEDADEMLMPRREGNAGMAELLNATDGVVSDSSIKFVFSTNLNRIDAIDPALLRPGRCFDILCFRTLTADEARKVRRVMRLDESVITDDNKSYKLAEVLSDAHGTKQLSEPIVRPRFGMALT